VTEASRRAAVVASLASTLSRAVALGHEVAARIVHEAKGRLLGLPVAPEG
jgi:N-acetylglucosamine kinase-like BadF-type ATPase